jgi:hypothetical protein
MLGMSAFDPMFLRWKNGRLHKVRDVRFWLKAAPENFGFRAV